MGEAEVDHRVPAEVCGVESSRPTLKLRLVRFQRSADDHERATAFVARSLLVKLDFHILLNFGILENRFLELFNLTS